MKYDKKFFDWLESVGKLNFYEAARDIACDYTAGQRYRHEAADTVEELKREYRNLNPKP